MKKLILLTIVSCVMASSSFAQDSKVEDVFKKYRFGLYVGPTFNSLKSTASEAGGDENAYGVINGKGHTSFSAGLNMELNLNEKYTVYSGIGLDWNGGTMSVERDITKPLEAEYARSATVDYKNQYLSIPLGIKMYAAELGDVKIFAQTGVELSLLLSQRGTYSIMANDSTTLTETEVVKLNDYGTTTPLNFGWHIGAGAEYILNNGSAAYLSLLYRNGIIDYTSPGSNKDGYKYDDGNVRSNSFAIRIGYFF